MSQDGWDTARMREIAEELETLNRFWPKWWQWLRLSRAEERWERLVAEYESLRTDDPPPEPDVAVPPHHRTYAV